MATSDDMMRAKLAVQRVDAVQISPQAARFLVHCLGRLAAVLGQQNGCAPEALVTLQHALAEPESPGASDLLPLGYELVDTETAANMLGLKADSVRWHRRRGNLESRKVGRQLMITVASIENLKVRLTERKGA